MQNKERSVQNKKKKKENGHVRGRNCSSRHASFRGWGGAHTEMDWMRLKAEVLAGVMTPVRLLDLATGLTLLLQGS